MIAGQPSKNSSGSLLIIFLDRSKSGNWEKVGQGILSTTEDERKILAQAKRRHVAMGCANETYICNCIPGSKRGPFQFSRPVPFTIESSDAKEIEERAEKTVISSPGT
jgi:hypothetical protein